MEVLNNIIYGLGTVTLLVLMIVLTVVLFYVIIGAAGLFAEETQASKDRKEQIRKTIKEAIAEMEREDNEVK